jgi:hypothetical protein
MLTRSSHERQVLELHTFPSPLGSQIESLQAGFWSLVSESAWTRGEVEANPVENLLDVVPTPPRIID